MPDLPNKRNSRFDFSLDEIRSWGGDRQFVEALEQYANKGDVLNPRFENGIGEADIQHAGHVLHTRFRTLPGKRGMVENLCPCASSQRDGRILPTRQGFLFPRTVMQRPTILIARTVSCRR